jgi:hypothetical protein
MHGMGKKATKKIEIMLVKHRKAFYLHYLSELELLP